MIFWYLTCFILGMAITTQEPVLFLAAILSGLLHFILREE